MNKIIKLKELDGKQHLELLMSWRSSPLVFKYFYKQKRPLTWKQHLKFWKNRKDRKDWLILFYENGLWRKVGSVSVDHLSKKYPEISIYIGEVTLHRQGVGSQALKQVIDWIKDNKLSGARAIVSRENIASQKLFEKLLFKKIRLIRNDLWYLYQLEF